MDKQSLIEHGLNTGSLTGQESQELQEYPVEDVLRAVVVGMGFIPQVVQQIVGEHAAGVLTFDRLEEWANQ